MRTRSMRRALPFAGVAGGAPGACGVGARGARGWPSKPARIVPPYPAGGSNDQVARATGMKPD